MSQSNPVNSSAAVRARLKARQSLASPLHRSGVRGEAPAGTAHSEDNASAGQKVIQQVILQQLSREVRQLETAGRQAAERSVTSTGYTELDACLPGGGYAAGSVIEYLRHAPGCGASYLAWAAAACAMRGGDGFLVVVDARREVYPPALQSLGIGLDKTIFVRPESQADAIWSMDQALRTSAVAAVVAELDFLDDRAARRLQLAAEQGGGLGLLLRPLSARRGASWAEVQWVVRGVAPNSQSQAMARASSGVQRLLDVQLARIRGGRGSQIGRVLRLEIGPKSGSGLRRERHEQNPLRLASELARATRASRRSRTG